MLDYSKLREEFKNLLDSYSPEELIECADSIEKEMRFEAIGESYYEATVPIETTKSSTYFSDTKVSQYEDNSSYNEKAA